MAPNAWKQRIRRAETLALQYPFAKEILEFYVHLARFQQNLYEGFEHRASLKAAKFSPAGVWVPAMLSGQEGVGTLALENFPPFLTLVENYGTERLAQIARELRGAPQDTWLDLMNGVWSGAEPPSKSEEFLSFAFLQPYAEFIGSRAHLQLEGYSSSLCPFCNRQAGFGLLRPQGDGAKRGLVCGFCLTEWEFRRIICPGCGEEGNAKLPVFTAESLAHVRVECCDTCQTYIKSIDLTNRLRSACFRGCSLDH